MLKQNVQNKDQEKGNQVHFEFLDFYGIMIVDITN